MSHGYTVSKTVRFMPASFDAVVTAAERKGVTTSEFIRDTVLSNNAVRGLL